MRVRSRVASPAMNRDPRCDGSRVRAREASRAVRARSHRAHRTTRRTTVRKESRAGSRVESPAASSVESPAESRVARPAHIPMRNRTHTRSRVTRGRRVVRTSDGCPRIVRRHGRRSRAVDAASGPDARAGADRAPARAPTSRRNSHDASSRCRGTRRRSIWSLFRSGCAWRPSEPCATGTLPTLRAAARGRPHR